MQAGARDVVRRERPDAADRGGRAGPPALPRARAVRAGRPSMGRMVDRLLPQGRRRQDHVAVNLALALTRQGRPQGLPGRPRPRLRRRRDHHAAVPDPLDRAGRGVGGRDRPADARGTADPARGLPDAARRARRTPTCASGSRRCWSRKILRTLREGFDYVVVDTAPSFDDQTLTALDETDECVIVATLDVPTLKNVKVALETLDMLNIARGHRHLLLNRADDAVGIGTDKVETILGMEVAAQVATSIEIAAATNAGTPIVAAKPQHQSSAAHLELAAKVVGEQIGTASAESASNGTAHARRTTSRPVPTQEGGRTHEQSLRPPRGRPRGHERQQAGKHAERPTTRPSARRTHQTAPTAAVEAEPPSVPAAPPVGVQHHGHSAGAARTRVAADDPRQPAADRIASTSSRPACTPSCSRSSARSCTTRTWTRPSSTSGSAPCWPTCSARQDRPLSNCDRAAGHPGDQRRHPGLRADRALPARPGRLRGDGQRPRRTSGWRSPAG